MDGMVREKTEGGCSRLGGEERCMHVLRVGWGVWGVRSLLSLSPSWTQVDG